MDLVINTSGSTDNPKTVVHNEQSVNQMLNRSISELKLTSNDTVLNVFPSNVIAYYAITALPAIKTNARLISVAWNPYSYIDWVHTYKPTVIGLVPPQIKALTNTKMWRNADLSSVRYCVTGSQPVEQWLIDVLLEKGVGIVGNWYGSTEFPPPIFVGYNSITFDFSTMTTDYKLDFKGDSVDAELYLNNIPTGDVFNVEKRVFSYRQDSKTVKNNTWKS